LGVASAEQDGVRVTCLAVVNAFGDVIDTDGRVLAGTTAPEPRFRRPQAPPPPGVNAPPNTVLGVVMTTALIDKPQAHFLAARGSDGMTRSIRPAHTRYDGDVVFAVAGPASRASDPGDLDVLGLLASDAMAAAIRDAVRR
jgi:L-aminopeptidase/D-esterase-like protein